MFKLEINLSNAAFEDWQSEVARILCDIADKLDHDDGRGDAGGFSRKILDINGNACGSWGVQRLK